MTRLSFCINNISFVDETRPSRKSRLICKYVMSKLKDALEIEFVLKSNNISEMQHNFKPVKHLKVNGEVFETNRAYEAIIQHMQLLQKQ